MFSKKDSYHHQQNLAVVYWIVFFLFVFNEQHQKDGLWLLFILYILYFKMNQQLSNVGARVPCPEKIFQGPLRKPGHTDTFQELLMDILFPEDIWSRRLLPKAFLSSCPLGTWGHNEQIRFSCWEGDCMSMELSEPTPPSLDELDSTAPEPRSPVSPPVNQGVFLTGLWEINLYMTLRSVALWSLYKVGLSLPLELLVAERLLLSQILQRT